VSDHPAVPAQAFERARRAVDAHDLDGLLDLLVHHPGLARAEGPNRNDLVAMAAGTCDDRTVELLLEHGADPAHANVNGWTALHQAAYAGAVHLIGPLLAAGARTDGSARGDGGTPLVVALFWGHAETADALQAAGGVDPRNLRAASGVGDGALVDALLAGPDAGRRRAFHRPHSGFPAWEPRDDPQEVLDEALSYAARNGRDDVLATLVAAGARVDAEVYRGTALAWAATRGRDATVRALLALGADPDGRSGFGGPEHGRDVTPLHLAAEGGHDGVAAILLQAGADPRVVDGLGYGPPAGWAAHNGHRELAALLRAAPRA
jgi:ankyrin repeat protein